jgi:hypothetical protein
MAAIEVPASGLMSAGIGPETVNNLDKGDKDLRKMVKAGLTMAGEEWLTVALDPFHDAPQRIQGQPTYERADTIVQCIKGTVDFKRTPGAGPWDLHIALLNQDVTTGENGGLNSSIRQTRRFGDMLGSRVVPGSNNTQDTFGLLTSAQCSTGLKTWPNGAGPADASVEYRGHGPTKTVLDGGTPPKWTRNNNYMDGQHKIIAIGWEVVNTTPLLYRGGSATCYRAPQLSEEVYTNLYNDQGVIQQAYHEMSYNRAPPANVDEAALLPDSTSWDAALGCYMVGTLQGELNPFEKPKSLLRIYDGIEAHATADSRGVLWTGIQAENSTSPDWAAAATDTCPTSMSANNFATSGIYFHNLPEQTVLTMNWRVIVERAPSVSETDLVVLTSPSPTYDELAWRFYSEARSRMPVGVPLNQNFFGTWFKDAAKAAVGAVPRLLKGDNAGEVLLDGVADFIGHNQRRRRTAKPAKRREKEARLIEEIEKMEHPRGRRGPRPKRR